MVLSALTNALYNTESVSSATRRVCKLELRDRILDRDPAGLHDFNGAKTKRASSDYRTNHRPRPSNGFASTSRGISTKKLHELHSLGKYNSVIEIYKCVSKHIAITGHVKIDRVRTGSATGSCHCQLLLFCLLTNNKASVVTRFNAIFHDINSIIRRSVQVPIFFCVIISVT